MYLLITGAALLYTVLRIPVLLHVPLVTFSYGIMAPYQGFERMNADLRAEGREKDGTWGPIDISRYYPLEAGEVAARKHLFPFRARGDAAMREAYTELAIQLREHEREQGRIWNNIHLFWDEWPISSEGYSFLRKAPHVHSVLLVEIP